MSDVCLLLLWLMLLLLLLLLPLLLLLLLTHGGVAIGVDGFDRVDVRPALEGGRGGGGSYHNRRSGGGRAVGQTCSSSCAMLQWLYLHAMCRGVLPLMREGGGGG